MYFIIPLLALLAMSSPATAETFDSIAAVINNEAVSCYDIERDASDMKRQMAAAGSQSMPTDAELRKQALNQNINKLLQLQAAKDLELSVSEEELAQTIKNVETSNNLLPGQLAEALRQQGLDFNEYKQKISDQMLIGKLINVAVRSKVQPGEEAMREYYRKYLADGKPRREVQLAQLFLALPDEPTPAQVAEVRKKIRGIRDQLQQGTAFEQMVTLHSQAPDRGNGGVMGWFSAGAISQRFARALELPVGAVSEPIRSPSGFYLIKAVEERLVDPETTGESYDEIHARHILLQIPSDADEATRSKVYQRAEEISARMQDADDEEFATRAKEDSQGPSAAKGGDLGWFRPGTMVASFDEAAFALQAGETSGVIETGFGLHIIRVVARRHIDPNSYEAHRDQIQRILSDVEMQEQMPRWLMGLRARANVELRQCDVVPLVDVEISQPAATASTQTPEDVVEAWRKAWSDQDLDAYFSYYSPNFQPGNGMSHKAWKAARNLYITNKKYIRVSVSNLEVKEKDGKMQVLFDQLYESDALTSRDRKLLLMEKSDQGWKIVRELTAVKKDQ